MIKHVCDICGKDAVYENFVMPVHKEYAAMSHGVKLACYTELEKGKMDLCLACMQKIADVIDDMRA